MDKAHIKELSETLRHMSHIMLQRRANILDYGLSFSQAAMLEKLKEAGPMKVSDLAESLYMTAGNVTGMTDKLIAAGYVERKRSETDRRIVNLAITADGLRILEGIKAQKDKLFHQMFGGLSDEDADQLIRIYNIILKNIENSRMEDS